jgi:predicted transposase YdaD
LFKFIDWIMVLPEGLKQAFWHELRTYEEEKRMPYITSVEEIGFERGLQQGVQQGAQQGIERERSLILRLLNRKVGSLPAPIIEQVNALAIEQLEALGEALLEFTAIADLTHWLENQG